MHEIDKPGAYVPLKVLDEYWQLPSGYSCSLRYGVDWANPGRAWAVAVPFGASGPRRLI